jgi:two-component system, OmpR family, sensor histidine kinase KdpD
MVMQKLDQEQSSESFFDRAKDVRKKRLDHLKQFLFFLAMLAITTILNIFLAQIIHPSSLVFVYLVPTIASAIYLGNWAAVLSFTCGFFIFNFLYVEPYYTLHISKPEDIYNVTVYFTIAALITYLINLIRRQNTFLKDRLDRVSLIEDMSRDFLSISPMDKSSLNQDLPESLRTKVLSQLGNLALKYAKMTLDVPAFVCFREEDGSLKIWAKNSDELAITEQEKDAATWTLNNGEVSGAGTHTHSNTPFYFIPLKSIYEIIGVLGILYDSKDLFPEQRRLLETISNLTTIIAARWTGV